jgi:hypothetical protein
MPTLVVEALTLLRDDAERLLESKWLRTYVYYRLEFPERWDRMKFPEQNYETTNISLEQVIRIRNLEINPTIIFIRFAIISASKVYTILQQKHFEKRARSSPRMQNAIPPVNCQPSPCRRGLVELTHCKIKISVNT